VGIAQFAAAQFIRALPRTEISHAVGRLCELPLPSAVSTLVTSAYCRAYRVQMAEVAEQSGAFATFDEFFTRQLRPGARPIAEAPVVSPSDGVISATGPIDGAARFFVKGSHYELGELVGDHREAPRYAGGSFAVIYLSPRDYHRVHSPVDGKLTELRALPGDLFPVNQIGERFVPKLLSRNQRVAFIIDTPQLGRVTAVMVGATIVGRIGVAHMGGKTPSQGVHQVEPAVQLQRGSELGVFHLGSTVVLLLEPGNVLRRPVGPVLCGQSLLSPG
jgi:phosphatidylserine decarboxylase